MKKMSIVLVAVALVCGLSGLAQADTVTVTKGSNGTTSGGEFTITVHDGPLKNIYGQLSFTSFCIELNEYVDLGNTYNYAISSGAISGGLGGGSPDPISDQTAYLYLSFRNGTLNYSGDASADALQDAIWVLENERTSASKPGAQAYINEANTAVGTNNFKNLGRVSALNLTTLRGGPAQDMLTLTIPVPGAIWLGMGLVGCIGLVGGVRRRFQAK